METVRLRQGDGVLLLRLGAVGDVVRTLPSLARLRESAPGIRIAWVVEPPSAPLLPRAPWLDEILVFPRKALQAPALARQSADGMRKLQAFLTAIRAFRPTLSIDFQGTAKSSLLGWLSGAPWRLGFDRAGSREGSFLLNNLRVHPSSERLNRVHKNLELLGPLHPAAAPLKFPFREEGPSDKVLGFLASLGEGTRVVLHAGTSRRQRHKQWPAENFARLAGSLAREGWVPVLTWGPGEEEMIREIRSLSGESSVPTPPLDVEEMRHVIAGCHLFVGADTGPMHLAWSQGIPVVALFGSTDPRINGPLGEGHRILAPAWENASPPPSRGDSAAIRRVEPEAVLQAVRGALACRPGAAAQAPAR